MVLAFFMGISAALVGQEKSLEITAQRKRAIDSLALEKVRDLRD
jgi:demethoxyubiquinone hydroxylase (CLK1/Coq7/Cat5 family)